MLSSISSMQRIESVELPVIAPVSKLSVCSVQDLDLEMFQVEGVGDLRALAVHGEDVVWIGGTGGKMAKTEDGGQSWVTCAIPGGEALDIRALKVFSRDVVCAMSAGDGGLSRVYRTVDGGLHWDIVLSSDVQELFFNAMVFWDEKNGILLSDPVDGRFVLFRTDNCGESWQQINPLEMPFAMDREAAFAASNSCLAVHGSSHVWFCTGGGNQARIFYSRDAGLHWDVTTTPIEVNSFSSGIFSLSFLNEEIGIAVGGDYKLPIFSDMTNMIITMDGGRSWEAVNHKPLAGRHLSSVTWGSEKEVLVIDESHSPLHSVAVAGKQGWAVGSDQLCAKFSMQ